jgi:intein/homing endonuclease
MANNTIARLVGHAFGDGSIHNKKQYFIYTNSDENLQQNVKKLVKSSFGIVSLNQGTAISGTPRYQYSNKVGRVLVSFGAPIGSKVLNFTQIPKWIKNGSRSSKAAFLAALYDDEGYFRDSRNCRQIVFKAAKIYHLRTNLTAYLEDVRKLLYEFGIESSEIKFDQIKKREDGKKMISLRFWITGRNNFALFRKSIPLFHKEKRRKLLKMVRAG